MEQSAFLGAAMLVNEIPFTLMASSPSSALIAMCAPLKHWHILDHGRLRYKSDSSMAM